MNRAPRAWALIVHGGAKTIAAQLAAAHEQGVRTAAETGAAVLAAGGSALDAVEASIRQLEDDPTFNAGDGSVRNADGDVELDASIMDGRTLAIGAVGAVKGLRHPISVARRLLQQTPVLLVADGARRFASASEAEFCTGTAAASVGGPTPVGGDTVGCVALDCDGHLACGLSTGGLEGKHPGRIGDTPLPGCGFYADDMRGAAAFSGDGESIARLALAGRVMAGLERSVPQRALEAALQDMTRVGGEAGGIALDRLGRFGCAHNSQHFAVAAACADGPLRAGVMASALGDLIDHG